MAPPLFKWKKARPAGHSARAPPAPAAGSSAGRPRARDVPHLPELSLSQSLLPQLTSRFALLRSRDAQEVRDRLRAQRQRGADAFLTEEEEWDLLSDWAPPVPAASASRNNAPPTPSSLPGKSSASASPSPSPSPSPPSASQEQFPASQVHGSWASTSSIAGLDRLADELRSNMSASGRGVPFSPRNPTLSPSVRSAASLARSSCSTPGPSPPSLRPHVVGPPPPARAAPPPPVPVPASASSSAPLLAHTASASASASGIAQNPHHPAQISPAAPATPIPSHEDEEELMDDLPVSPHGHGDTDADVEHGRVAPPGRGALEKLSPENYKRISQALDEVFAGWALADDGFGFDAERVAANEFVKAAAEAAAEGGAAAPAKHAVSVQGSTKSLALTGPPTAQQRPVSDASLNLGIPGGFPTARAQPSTSSTAASAAFARSLPAAATATAAAQSAQKPVEPPPPPPSAPPQTGADARADAQSHRQHHDAISAESHQPRAESSAPDGLPIPKGPLRHAQHDQPIPDTPTHPGPAATAAATATAPATAPATATATAPATAPAPASPPPARSEPAPASALASASAASACAQAPSTSACGPTEPARPGHIPARTPPQPPPRSPDRPVKGLPLSPARAPDSAQAPSARASGPQSGLSPVLSTAGSTNDPSAATHMGLGPARPSDLSPGGTPWSPLSPIARFPNPPQTPTTPVPASALEAASNDCSPDPAPDTAITAAHGTSITAAAATPHYAPRLGKVAELAARWNNALASDDTRRPARSASPTPTATPTPFPESRLHTPPLRSPPLLPPHLSLPADHVSPPISPAMSSVGSFATASELDGLETAEPDDPVAAPLRVSGLLGHGGPSEQASMPLPHRESASAEVGSEVNASLVSAPAKSSGPSWPAPQTAAHHDELIASTLAAYTQSTVCTQDPHQSPEQPAERLGRDSKPGRRQSPQVQLAEQPAERRETGVTELEEPLLGSQHEQEMSGVQQCESPPGDRIPDQPVEKSPATSEEIAPHVGAQQSPPSAEHEQVDPAKERARQIAAAQLFGEPAPKDLPETSVRYARSPAQAPVAAIARAAPSSRIGVPATSGPTPEDASGAHASASPGETDLQPGPVLAQRSDHHAAARGASPTPQPYTRQPTVEGAPGEVLGLAIDHIALASFGSHREQVSGYPDGRTPATEPVVVRPPTPPPTQGVGATPHVADLELARHPASTQPAAPALSTSPRVETVPPLPSPVETVPPLPSPWEESAHPILSGDLGLQDHARRGNFIKRARDALPSIHLNSSSPAFEPMYKRGMQSSEALVSPTQLRPKLLQTSSLSSPRLSAHAHRKVSGESPPVSSGMRLLSRESSEHLPGLSRRKSEQGRVSKLFTRFGSGRRKNGESSHPFNRQPAINSGSGSEDVRPGETRFGETLLVRELDSPALSPGGSGRTTPSLLPSAETTPNIPVSARSHAPGYSPSLADLGPSGAPEASPSTLGTTGTPPRLLTATTAKLATSVSHEQPLGEERITPTAGSSPASSEDIDEVLESQTAQQVSVPVRKQPTQSDTNGRLRSEVVPYTDVPHVDDNAGRPLSKTGSMKSLPESPHQSGPHTELVPPEQQQLDDIVPEPDGPGLERTEGDTNTPMPGSPPAESPAKQERRKTGREVVRRTLIFLDEGDENKRKSVMSILSRSNKGKSRMEPEMEAELLKLLKRQSMSASAGINPSAAMESLEGRRVAPANGDQSLSVSFPREDDDAMEQLNFHQPLRLLTEPRRRNVSALSTATRFTQSSYAGSVYSNEEDVTFEANEHEVPPVPAAFRDEVVPRSGLAGLEVTERADGSVVWQVLHGLADPDDSTADPYNLLFHRPGARESSIFDLETMEDRDDTKDDKNDHRLSTMSDRENWRNFLVSRRAAAQPASQPDSSYNLPLAPARAENAERDSALDSTHTEGHSGQNPAPEAPDTHIIWTTDNDVAAMLDSLSRGIDSAKFEIKLEDVQEPAAPVATAAPAAAPPIPPRLPPRRPGN